MSTTDERRADGDISPELDELSSELMGDAFDLLADGQPLNVLVVVEDQKGHVAPFEFLDDGPEVTLKAARQKIVSLGESGGDPTLKLAAPVRYAIAYSGAVCDEDGVYRNAVILEFGERGRNSYSAYSFYTGEGLQDRFRWTEPAPAGELESLL